MYVIKFQFDGEPEVFTYRETATTMERAAELAAEVRTFAGAKAVVWIEKKREP